MSGHCGKCGETMCICARIEKQPRKEAMSKSELKRLCAQNPVEMAERIVELERRVKVLTDALVNCAVPIEAIVAAGSDKMHRVEVQAELLNAIKSAREAISQTPQLPETKEPSK